MALGRTLRGLGIDLPGTDARTEKLGLGGLFFLVEMYHQQQPRNSA